MSRADRDPRLGIVAFLGAAALVLIVLLVVARYPTLFRRGREYRSVFTNVAGLNLGDEVRYGGLLVGTVTAEELDPHDPTRIVVRFRVKRNTPVRVDTRAAITQVGLLGEPYLALEPGRPDAPPLPAGATLASENNIGFPDAMARIAEFLDRADSLLAGAQEFASTSPWERIDRTLSHFDRLAVTADTSGVKLMVQLDQSSRRLNALMDRTEQLVATLDTTVRSSGPGLATTQQEALQTLREMHMLVGDVREALQEGGGLDQMVRNLAVTSDNLAALSARLERDPTSVFKKRALPKKTVGPSLRD